MEIYHTETQADYDALMVELEADGYKWRGTANKPTQWNGWKLTGKETGVRLDGDLIAQGSIAEYKSSYEQTPITTYKAKTDEKMKFTKSNIEGLVNKYFDDNVGECPGNLIAEIYAMDDTPEKAIVPKCFDDWYQEIKNHWISGSSAKQFALWKVCQQGFGHDFEDVRDRKISYSSNLAKWVMKNKMLAIDAVLNGYTIEPEQLYYIPLPDLKTTDGIQQVLTKRSKNGRHYFASRPNEKLKQRYTKEELEQVPEVYKSFAKPIEEETE